MKTVCNDDVIKENKKKNERLVYCFERTDSGRVAGAICRFSISVLRPETFYTQKSVIEKKKRFLSVRRKKKTDGKITWNPRRNFVEIVIPS